MPIFRNIFSCRSQDTERKEHIKGEIDTLKDRVNKLEMNYDNVKEILGEIKMDIKLINMNISNALQQRKD